MARSTKILSVSLPASFLKAVEELAEQTDQTKSELIRNALRAYMAEEEWYRQRFLDAYKETKDEPFYPLDQVKKEFKLQ